MKRMLNAWIVVKLGVLLNCCYAFGEPPKSIADQLQGKWKVIDMEERGKRFSKKTLEDDPIECEIKGDRISLIRDEKRYEHRFVLETTKKPMHLNILLEKGGVNHAIIAIDKDTLVLCASEKIEANRAEDRPIAFTSQRENNKDLDKLIMITFCRQK